MTGYTLVHEDRYGDPDKPDTVQVRDFRTPRTCVVCGGVFRLALESTIVARPLEAGEPHARRRARRG